MAMTVPEIVRNAIESVCRQINVTPAAIDVGSIGAACNFSLNQQGLLSGLMAMTPGHGIASPWRWSRTPAPRAGRPCCRSSRSCNWAGATSASPSATRKCATTKARWMASSSAKCWDTSRIPDERAGKSFVFPHLFAEIMRDYMQAYGVTEAQLAQIAVNEYANAKYNPWAQMNKVQITLDQAMKIEGINRYVVEGLPLKTYDCSQITDGYAALILATEEGLKKLGVPKAECVEIAGYAQATDPLQKEVATCCVPPAHTRP